MTPQRQKEDTIRALVDVVEATARHAPTIMLFEDALWADPTTLEVLDLLIDRVADMRLLVIITHRPEFKPTWLGHGHVTALALSRLSRAQSAAVVSRLAGGKALPDDLMEQIVAKTDGVPLFVEELTKSMLESDGLRDIGDRYAYVGSSASLTVPATLRDSLMARLDRLAPVREIAQIGACIGREFRFQILERVAQASGELLVEGLRQLVDAGLIFRKGTPPEAIYTFKHALVQDVAYDSLLKSKRAHLHSQIARVLAQEFFDLVKNAPEILAHHYTQAANLTEAIPLWLKAGQLALSRVTLQEAVGHFQRGLAVALQLPPSLARDALELSIREPLTAAWVGLRGWAAPDVEINARAILQLAKGQGKNQSLLIGFWGIYTNTLTQGRIADSLDWAQHVLAQANESRDDDLMALGHVCAMDSHLHLGRLLDARDHGNRALALYDPQRAGRAMKLIGQDIRTFVGVYAAHWTWMLGYPDQALQLIEKREAEARQLTHPFNLAFALTLGAYTFDYRREPEQLLERVSEAERIAREHNVPFIYQVMVPQAEGLARLRNGELSESVASLRRALENWNRFGGQLRTPYLKSALAEALALQGDLGAALDLIDECIEQIERPCWQERWHLSEVLRLKGWMLIVDNRSEEAEAPLRASIEWARQQQAKSWELRSSVTFAKLLATRGQRDTALQLLAPIYNWFTEGFDTKDLREAKALLQALES